MYGVVMVSYTHKLREDRLPIENPLLNGAFLCLRPVLVTALVASISFIPMAVSTATGTDVQ